MLTSILNKNYGENKSLTCIFKSIYINRRTRLSTALIRIQKLVSGNLFLVKVIMLFVQSIAEVLF